MFAEYIVGTSSHYDCRSLVCYGVDSLALHLKQPAVADIVLGAEHCREREYALLLVTPLEELHVKTAVLGSLCDEFIVIDRDSELFAESVGYKQSATSELASDGDDDLFHDCIIIELRVLLMSLRP